MTSPLVSRLLSEIGRASDIETRYSLMAELGCYWARIGEFQEAERIRQEVRSRFGDGRSLQVSVRVMCLEGLQLYFTKLDPKARDRFVRAHLLSKAAGSRPLIALTSSWLSHIDFNLNRFDDMAQHAAECLSSLDGESDVMADCRVSLVLGDALLYAGEVTHSNRWYERARRCATSSGDQAAIGAMTYNRAALRVTGMRIDSLKITPSASGLRLLLREVETAINYQAIAELRSLDHLLLAAKAGCFMLQERFVDAEPILSRLLSSAAESPESSQHSIASADLAALLARTNRRSESIARLQSINEEQYQRLPADDAAIAYASLANAASECGDRPLSERFAAISKHFLESHDSTLSALRVELNRFHELPPSGTTAIRC
ncbi:MAG: hypothetical protein KGL35_32850 [Bradyrhizobium sp.]|nr:hypothetical protein [Bradyrhizobium sp.]